MVAGLLIAFSGHARCAKKPGLFPAVTGLCTISAGTPLRQSKHVQLRKLLQGHRDTCAVLLLWLLKTGNIAPVVRINNALVGEGRVRESAAVAGAVLPLDDTVDALRLFSSPVN